MIYKMNLTDSVDSMTFELLEVPIQDNDIEGAVDNILINGNVFTDYLWLKKKYVQKWSIMCPDEYNQLRGFYTRQWENAEVPTYKLFVGENRSEILTASGNPISLTNSTDYDAPILDFEMKGNATQNGTPTPDAPVPVITTTGENVVQITGKNLCYKTELQDTSNIRFYMHKPSGSSFTLSATINVATANNSLYLRVDGVDYGVAGTLSGDANTRQSRTLTPNPTQLEAILNGSEIYLLFYKNNAGFTLPTDAQIENSDSATTYEPYQGQEYEVNLGKNLVEITDGTFTSSGINSTFSNGLINMSGTVNASWGFNIKGGNNALPEELPIGKYVFSINQVLPFNISFNIKDKDGTSIGSATITAGNKSATITTASPIVYYTLWSNAPINTSVNITGLSIQFEKGSTATTYSPYFTPIELCKIGTYQDYIYKSGDDWYVHKETGKVVLDGSENWNALGSNQCYRTSVADAIQISSVSNLSPVISNNYSSETPYDVYYGNVNYGVSLDNTGSYIRIRNKDCADNTAFKTWLASNPTAVYYALATATDTKITNSALVAQLDAIVSAYLPRGAVNISLTGTGAQGSMVLDYELIISKETIIKGTTTVRLTLTDGGVINPCGCRQNIQLEMRETAQ